MSSIIDALKKSDHNRSTESVANVNQIKFTDQPSNGRRRSFWWLLVLLLVVAAGVFAWTQGWHHSAINQVSSWLGADTSSQTEPKPVVKDIEPSREAEPPVNDIKSVAADTSNKLTPPKPDTVKSKAANLAQVKPHSDIEQKATTMAKRQGNQGQQADTGEDTLQVVPRAEKAENTDKKLANKEQVRATAQQQRKDLEPAMKQDFLLVHQIDFEIRKNIPPIKLNIHIYDPEPENRMVILNGVKYTTGDSIEDLVTVEEINQDGVVLTFEGVKFLIPK